MRVNNHMADDLTPYLQRVLRSPGTQYEATKGLGMDALLFVIRDEIHQLFPKLEFKVISEKDPETSFFLLHCIITSGLPIEDQQLYKPDVAAKLAHGDLDPLDDLNDYQDSYDYTLYSKETNNILNTIQLIFEQYNNHPAGEPFINSRFHTAVEIDVGYEQRVRQKLVQEYSSKTSADC